MVAMVISILAFGLGTGTVLVTGQFQTLNPLTTLNDTQNSDLPVIYDQNANNRNTQQSPSSSSDDDSTSPSNPSNSNNNPNTPSNPSSPKNNGTGQNNNPTNSTP